jgi:hypothetical protein
MTADRQQRLRAREQKARLYAEHLALRVAKHDGVFTLSERYGARKKLGTYHSVDALRRAIRYRHHCMLKQM